MRLGWSREDDGIDVGPSESRGHVGVSLHPRSDLAGALQRRLRGVADEPQDAEPMEVPDEILAPVAATENRESEIPAHGLSGRSACGIDGRVRRERPLAERSETAQNIRAPRSDRARY